MSFEFALRFTEILLAFAFIQQSLEHLTTVRDERFLFIQKFVLSGFLLSGFFSKWILVLLFINALFILKRFRGPYNGGSDRMGLLVLSCLCLINFMPSLMWQQYIFAYLALQVVLSYFMPGVYKLINPAWWNGSVLKDIFEFSSFPASEVIREFSKHSKLVLVATWSMLLFELLFPIVFVSKIVLFTMLALALVFHLLNTYLFGFNRFTWIWLAAYPSLIWFQEFLTATLH